MSQNALLRIQNLKVCAGEKEILHGIDLDIHENELPMCSWGPTAPENPHWALL